MQPASLTRNRFFFENNGTYIGFKTSIQQLIIIHPSARQRSPTVLCNIEPGNRYYRTIMYKTSLGNQLARVCITIWWTRRILSPLSCDVFNLFRELRDYVYYVQRSGVTRNGFFFFCPSSSSYIRPFTHNTHRIVSVPRNIWRFLLPCCTHTRT